MEHTYQNQHIIDCYYREAEQCTYLGLHKLADFYYTRIKNEEVLQLDYAVFYKLEKTIFDFMTRKLP